MPGRDSRGLAGEGLARVRVGPGNEEFCLDRHCEGLGIARNRWASSG